MKKLVVFLTLFCFVQNLSAQQFYTPPDSCLRMEIPNQEINGYIYSNPDSIMVDTCNYTKIPYVVKYAKKFGIIFKSNYYPFKHLLKKDEYAPVSEIIFPTIRTLFMELENNIGCKISLVSRNSNFSDSLQVIYPSFTLLLSKYIDGNKFDAYVNKCIEQNDTIKYFLFSSNIAIYVSGGNGGTGSVSTETEIIYPNPAIDFLNVNETISSNSNIEIMNLLGEKIINTPYSHKIDVSALSSGIYFIKINNQFYKFVKK